MDTLASSDLGAQPRFSLSMAEKLTIIKTLNTYLENTHDLTYLFKKAVFREIHE